MNTTSVTAYESVRLCESKEAEHARLQFDAHLEVYRMSLNRLEQFPSLVRDLARGREYTEFVQTPETGGPRGLTWSRVKNGAREDARTDRVKASSSPTSL